MFKNGKFGGWSVRLLNDLKISTGKLQNLSENSLKQEPSRQLHVQSLQ